MYNRILNRPMFKLGGKTNDAQGTGITSGLDAPRQGYANKNFVEQISEIDVSVPESTRKRAFWSGIGEGFSNARTLGEALSGAVKGQSAILGPAEAEASKRGFELDKMPLERKMAMDVAKAGIAETAAQTDERTLARAMKMKKEWEDANPGEDFIGSENYTDWEHLIIQATDGKITTLSEARQTALDILIADGETMFAKQWKMFEYSTKEQQAALLAQIKRLQDLFMGKNFEERASGGRIGYNTGVGPNVMDKNIQMSEQINTPQGDVSMTEDVNVMNADPMAAGAGSAGGEDPYLLLRARLPQEITDDVVRLIAYNPEAFKDFASIESQEDVMLFNQKYGVELVLPTEQA